MRTLIILILLTTPAPAAEVIYYCHAGRYDKDIDQDFKHAFDAGWKHFQEISKRPLPKPELVYTTDTSKLRLYLYPDLASGNAAVTFVDEETYTAGREVMCFYYNSIFKLYAPERKAKVVAHELCHFYYRLRDQYKEGQTIKHDCVMGHFVVYGWTGQFCSDCQQQVDNYYKK